MDRERQITICSFFSGAGGLDKGFENEGYKIVLANEFNKAIWETYEKNHEVDIYFKKGIEHISMDEIPDCMGIIGGPACQPWSLAGNMKGMEDQRAESIYNFVDIINYKLPKFFLMENVKGMVSKTHINSFYELLEEFKEQYNVSYKLINCNDYGVGQVRERLFVIGFRKDLGITFDFDNLEKKPQRTLRDLIGDLPEAKPSINTTKPNKDLEIPNHEYYEGGYSSKYMIRNRKKNYDEPSFTIQASGRQAPIHPGCPDMKRIDAQHFEFYEGRESEYRRLSIREAARIQGFPDDFIFYYKNIEDGFKMVGNSVPVPMAEILAAEIKKLL